MAKKANQPREEAAENDSLQPSAEAAQATQAIELESPKTHEEDPFLTLSEVGRRIGKSPQTIGRWVEEGLLEAVRLPNNLRAIRQSALNRFIGGSALATKAV